MPSWVVNQVKHDVDAMLSDEATCVGWAFDKIEEYSGWSREKCFWWFATCLAAYLVVGDYGDLICNLICIVHPVYMSLWAIEMRDDEENTQWLTYWVIFALFSIVDYASEALMGYFPIYWLAKCVLFLWLSLSIYKGALRVYHFLLRGFVVTFIARSRWKLW
ncbi:receptor expression enhancing protein 5 [Trichuris trichiura]|uniref:Receptor expression-enhancing protein n=1 Tax=Trichuris trichiura TaxID=36087 RepID=A0A077YW98_TRITR|nr:receptor expression enhancing protein 5 [Trichuris trichiura]